MIMTFEFNGQRIMFNLLDFEIFIDDGTDDEFKPEEANEEVEMFDLEDYDINEDEDGTKWFYDEDYNLYVYDEEHNVWVLEE
jgi:hypothetical protein